MNYSSLPTSEADFHELRNKLIMYFAGRRLSPAEDYADEVIFRAIKKISVGEEIENINKYVFGIARFVHLEAYKEPKTVSLDPSGAISIDKDDREQAQRILPQLISDPVILEEESEEAVCLRECLNKLETRKREMLTTFYEIKGTDKTHIEQRKKLANENGMSPDTLYTNICRTRKKVGECVKKCIAK